MNNVTLLIKKYLSHFIKIPLLGISVLALLTACGGDDDNNNPPPAAKTGSLRVIHASVDSPAVDISLNGTTAISALDYAESSGYAELEVGDYDIAVDGLLPDGTTATVIDVEDFTIDEDSMTTVLAINNTASITPYVIDDTMTATPESDHVSLRVVHAAPDVPEVDIYLTAPDADLEMADPAFSFAFGQDINAGAVPSGTYQIRATLAGTTTVAYDSGEVDLSAFAGQKLLIAAVPVTNATQAEASPVQLLVATDSTSLTIKDVNTQVGARVVHLSPDAGTAAGGPVEVFATSDALGNDPVELIDAFAYTDVAPATDSHVAVPAGEYVFDVAPDTDMIGDSVYTSDPLELSAGWEYTVIASGLVTSTPAFELLATADSQRSISTQAAVKIVHGSTAAGTVDVYVTPAGDFSADDVLQGNAGSPLLDDFEYGTITDYVAVTPGDYDIRVVAGNAVAINVEAFTLSAGLVGTVIARGPIMPEGEPSSFGFVVLTN